MHQHWRLAVIGFCALAISLYVYTWTQTSYNISSVSSYFVPPGKCTPGDPYLLPGMIEWGSSANETRWVPFPSINSPQTPKNSTDLSGSEWESQEKMHADALEGWMGSLSKGDPEDQILEEMNWARGKLVIFIGEYLLKEGSRSSYLRHDRRRLEVSSARLLLILNVLLNIFFWCSVVSLRWPLHS